MSHKPYPPEHLLLPDSHGTEYLWQERYHLYSLLKARSRWDFPDHPQLHGFLWYFFRGFSLYAGLIHCSNSLITAFNASSSKDSIVSFNVISCNFILKSNPC